MVEFNLIEWMKGEWRYDNMVIEVNEMSILGDYLNWFDIISGCIIGWVSGCLCWE